MARIDSKICFLVFALLHLHTVTGQNSTAAAVVVEATTTAAPAAIVQPAALDPLASPTLHADVTDTVFALFVETGHPVSRNDTNVQEVVSMLMNGTVPTDADLMRMGFMPQAAPPPVSTPPPYSIPGNQPPLDTSVMFPSLPSGTQTGPSSGGSNAGSSSSGGFSNAGSSSGGFSNPGFTMGGGFPVNPPVVIPTGSQLPPQSGTGANDPFAGTLTNIPNPPVMPNFMSMMGPPATSPKPALGDPFSMNTINGGSAAQLPGLGPIDPNALGPKPNTGPVGGLGTPGSTIDLLGPLPPGMGGLPPGMGGLPPGMGGLPPGMGLPVAPPTGILDAPPPQRNGGGGGMNPMMMMMMMNPEMMDMMLSGESPMLTYMLMQQMNRRPQRPRPAPTSSMGPLGGFPGGASGFPGGAAGAGGLSMPFPGQSPMGGAPGGMMDMMSAMSAAGPGMLGGGPAGTPMDLSALTGLGAGLGPGAGTPVNPMDLMQGSLSSAAGPGVPPTDLLPFPGMSPGLPSLTGPIPSGAPITDPFAATVG